MQKMILNENINHNRVKNFCCFGQKKLMALNLLKSVMFLTAIPLMIAIVLPGCGDKNQAGGNKSTGRGKSDNSNIAAAIPVQVAAVKRGEISLSLLQTTTIEAIRQVDILTKVSGQVVKLPVEEGVRVKKGDLLAELYEAELKIEFIKTEVSMETDKTMLDRAQNMLNKNLIAEENYEMTRLQYESSKAAHDAARLQLEYTNVRAPFNGVVTVRNIELGQRVNVNQSLFVIADFNPLRAKIYVPEKNIGQIYEGQKAKITIEAKPGVIFSGVVKMISPVVDPSSGTSKVTIEIEDNKGNLKPGMFASVFITTETHHDALIIPKKALILESDLDQVYIYQDGSARKVNLQVGFTAGVDLEVLSGLEEGDLVVTAGQDGLREGLPLRIPDRDTSLTRATEESK